MLGGNIKMAMAALRSSKWRSLLTMLGIIIGVVSVVTTVSLGEGVKKQVAGQINRLGSDLITIRPGQVVTRDASGNITKINLSSGLGINSGSLPANDLGVIQGTPNVRLAVPISLISGGARTEERQYNSGYIIGTSEKMPEVLKQKVNYGAFFTVGELNRHVAVIGQTVAEQLFSENVPIGMSFSIHGQEFIVRGVMDKFDSPPLALGPDFNSAIFIPYEIGKQLAGGNVQLSQVLVRPGKPELTGATIAAINKRLTAAHGQQNDFTVLRQDENLAVTSDILNLLTGFIAGIAAISLLVGGIGIMNIMLVSVTERTREIGIRKAVGATNRQILGQFLVEALVLSVVGGIIGTLLALLINVLLRIFTNLQPVISWPVVLLASLVVLVVGVIFGITPAAKAARKDPIDALRYE